MRINEYKSLNEFTSQYVGEWAPSNGHWCGLDFLYHGTEYRLHTGSMYKNGNNILPDGREAMFGLYKKINNELYSKYELLGEYADMHDLLESRVIKEDLLLKSLWMITPNCSVSIDISVKVNPVSHASLPITVLHRKNEPEVAHRSGRKDIPVPDSPFLS